jgi:hypothetical protein
MFNSISKTIGFILGLSLAVSIAACGVRGNPQPPLMPSELGHGQPSFKRGTENLAYPVVPEVDSTPTQDKSQGKAKDKQQ